MAKLIQCLRFKNKIKFKKKKQEKKEKKNFSNKISFHPDISTPISANKEPENKGLTDLSKVTQLNVAETKLEFATIYSTKLEAYQV